MDRRGFLGSGLATPFAVEAAVQTARAGSAIVIDPSPQFEISPYLYMQFMEPLGTADSSVEAAWDYEHDDWRTQFVDTVRGLAPDVIRWGGLYSRYEHWREGIGPPAKRPWTRNYVWGGRETNRVGTHEFVDLCRRVRAEPLYCVNFMSDGVARFRNTKEGNRTGTAEEAAEWVSYANDPGHRERAANGAPQPFNINLWQLGNETSYGKEGFSQDEAIRRTIEFSRAMKARDRSIRLIGWGDRGAIPEGTGYWATELLKRAGEHIDYVAMHMMGQGPRRPDTVFRGRRYQREPEQAWAELLELADAVEKRVNEFEQASAHAPHVGLAITEGHLSLPPHNINPVLCEWLSAPYHARSLNIYQRHGRRVKIATIADFEGSRWTVNAVMLAVPGGACFLTPAGEIARLFKTHNGSHAVNVAAQPAGLDIAASRRENKFYLHVANLEYGRAVEASLSIAGMNVVAGRVFEIAPEYLREYVGQDQPDVFQPREKAVPEAPVLKWRFPAGSVSALELETTA